MKYNFGKCKYCDYWGNLEHHTCKPYEVQPHPEESEFVDIVDEFWYEGQKETKTFYGTNPEHAALQFAKWLNDTFYGDNELCKNEVYIKVVVHDRNTRLFFTVEAYMEPSFRSLEHKFTPEETDRIDAIRDDALGHWRKDIEGGTDE